MVIFFFSNDTKQPCDVVVMIPQAKDLFSSKKTVNTRSKHEDEIEEEEENVTFLGAEHASHSTFDRTVSPRCFKSNVGHALR